jgi:hypothetical protein
MDVNNQCVEIRSLLNMEAGFVQKSRLCHCEEGVLPDEAIPVR